MTASDKNKLTADLSVEQQLWNSGKIFIAGVDEVGRGPIAGPVVAAAVILKQNVMDLDGVTDSKQMTAIARERAWPDIVRNSVCISVAAASVKRIDDNGIMPAVMLAMKRSIDRLTTKPEYILVDGNQYPSGLDIPGEAIIKGDQKCLSIAAASVIAKVVRDRLMFNLDGFYPEYKFADHKGYATAYHLQILEKLGPTPHHRFSFSPIKQLRLAFGSNQIL